MAYYIGIDGGGTKTMYALFNEKKEMLSSVKTGGSNHENLEGYIPEAAGIIMGGVNALLEENGLQQGDITHVLMALAGIDHPYQRDEMEEELHKLGLTIPCSIYNDGFIVVKAGLTGKAGIGYNCGTGTCCNSVDSCGNLLQVGGFGELSSDAGGGQWIARKTYSLVYNDICLKRRKTACTEPLCKTFGITADREGLLSLIPKMEAQIDDTVRPMLDIFFDAVNEGDEAALDVVEEMADKGAAFIAAHIRSQQFDDEVVEVVLSGSIHVKLPSQVYVDKLMEKARQMAGRPLRFIKLTAAPVTGCINWMLEDR